MRNRISVTESLSDKPYLLSSKKPICILFCDVEADVLTTRFFLEAESLVEQKNIKSIKTKQEL